MPGYDQSGPRGAGPMTGGGRGMCGSSFSQAGTTGYGYGKSGRGRGCRRSSGRGRGFGYAGYGENALSKADEKAQLQSEVDALQASLASIQNRLAQLESRSSD